ncbi:MAG: lipase family protein [Iphinoe sp. HA4291-MV1]|jgi:triacylglycerol lipase|nr:lipase family protein [Iphinoe sp. HA4291-MV1]
MNAPLSFASFNSQASTYDANNAYLLAQLCVETYRREKVEKLGGKNENNDDWRKRVKQEASAWGFVSDRVYCFNNQGAQAILLADAEKVIVAFRGSEELSDWEVNFNRLKSRDFSNNYNLCLHTGFCNYLNNIWKPYKDPQERIEAKGIKAIIQEEMKNSSKSLWFTGHSLGGAVAVLAAANCIFFDNLPFEVSGVYTYGQPRVGDWSFAKLYNSRLRSKTFRFVNNNDVVTKIPTWAPLFLFRHVGQIKYLTQDGEILDFEKLNIWQKWQEIFIDIVKDLREEGINSITDHDMSTGYIPPLLRVISEADAIA